METSVKKTIADVLTPTQGIAPRIGIFDSGHGGKTVYQEIQKQLPHLTLNYLGDHQNAPYGNKSADEVLALTQQGVERLFNQGCRLVILACNTASAIALRHLQQTWLPTSPYQNHNVLGVVVPAVEEATSTPWAIKTPQQPQAQKAETIAVFATTRTIASNVYAEEILKRCPNMQVIQQACPHLAGAIENHLPEAEIQPLIQNAIDQMLAKTNTAIPHKALLGCTHYPLVINLFKKCLPPETQIINPAPIVAKQLKTYLHRHPQYV